MILAKSDSWSLWLEDISVVSLISRRKFEYQVIPLYGGTMLCSIYILLHLPSKKIKCLILCVLFDTVSPLTSGKIKSSNKSGFNLYHWELPKTQLILSIQYHMELHKPPWLCNGLIPTPCQLSLKGHIPLPRSRILLTRAFMLSPPILMSWK